MGRGNYDESELNRNAGVSRRQVLQSLGTAGTATIGLSGINTATAAQKPIDENKESPEVSVLSGSDRDQLLNKILSDTQVKKIRPILAENDWAMDAEGGVFMNVTPPEGRSYNGAVIPFTRPGDTPSEQRNLIWIEQSRVERIDNADLSHVTGHIAVKTDQSVSTKSGYGWKVTEYTVESSEVTATTTIEGENIADGVGTNDLTPPRGGGGSCGCLAEVTYCANIDYFCIASYVVAVIGTISSCAGCVESGGVITVACGLCLNAVLGMGLTGYSCGNPINCQTKYICADGDPFKYYVDCI